MLTGRSAQLLSISLHLLDIVVGASLDSTVMDTKVEVFAGTEASEVIVLAPKRLGFAQHALVARLLSEVTSAQAPQAEEWTVKPGLVRPTAQSEMLMSAVTAAAKSAAETAVIFMLGVWKREYQGRVWCGMTK